MAKAPPPLRWQSLIELRPKLEGLTWLTTSFLSWLLLNAYLGAIGQPGAPLDLAGTWAALVLMGAILTLTIAVVGSVFVVGEQMMRPLHPDSPVPRSTRVTFFIAATGALVALLVLEQVTGRTVVGLLAALPAELAASVGVRRWFLGSCEAVDRGKVVGLLGAWIVVATLLFLLVAAEFSIVLRVQLEKRTPFLLALGLSLIQLALCTFPLVDMGDLGHPREHRLADHSGAARRVCDRPDRVAGDKPRWRTAVGSARHD